MPDFNSELVKMAGAKCFATFDLAQGYWQLPLHPDSQECQSFVCPDGVFTPNRVQHGTTNATFHLQSIMEELMGDIKSKLTIWLDDNLAHTKSEEEHLELLEEFFKRIHGSGLKLHAEKCTLFATQIEFCGRIISDSGVRYAPKSMQTLQEMLPPSTGAELAQYMGAVNWMRSSIPNYAEKVAPLQALLEQVYDAAGSRTKKSAARVSLHGLWAPDAQACYKNIQKTLNQMMEMNFPDPEKMLCVFTDASDEFHAGMLTQIDKAQLDLEFDQQQHQPLAFCSGKFTGAQLRWTTPEKEGYAVVHTVTTLDYLLLSQELFSIFTDHRNLKFIYNPLSVDATLARHVVHKLQRWALKLSVFNYVIEHIEGVKNLWPDLLTRWAKQQPKQTRKSLSAVFQAPLAQELAPTALPSQQDILMAQKAAVKKNKEQAPDKRGAYGLRVTEQGAMWIPSEAVDLQLRLLVTAHCGAAGHRGHDATFDTLAQRVHWNTMTSDTRAFVTSCLLCLATTGGLRQPRPWSQTLHAAKVNEVLHFDYLYGGSSSTGEKYILICKDDLSGYVWLKPCVAPTADFVVETLTAWFGTFGTATVWVSDQASHFKCEVMKKLAKAMMARHKFTPAYSPWANGTVEVVCSQVLRAARALLSEVRLQPTDWPRVLALVQAILNNSPSPRLGGSAPLTVFTGHDVDNPLAAALHELEIESASLSFIRAQQLVHMEAMRESLDSLHLQAQQQATRRRQQAVERHNRLTNVRSPNFEVGDFVLVAAIMKGLSHKFAIRWQGPRRIVRFESPSVAEVEHLSTKKIKAVHCTRLKLYSEGARHNVEDLQELASHNEQELFTISKFVGHKYDNDRQTYCFLTAWRGFDEAEATWEPLGTLKEDAPALVDQYLDQMEDQVLAGELRLL
jgi:RNase H-like domain found in reverse transcriptase/Reverse transcriptase (RNA-dependent DNA polymerase)/Integrase zinc binding domain/Chromo (CHRromatin Organisation MOdifier) domain